MPQVNHYTNLGLSANGLNAERKPYSIQEIKKAYRKQSLKVHPDKNGSTPEATAHFKQLNESYNILRDPNQREQFDETLNSTDPIDHINFDTILARFFRKQQEADKNVQRLVNDNVSIHKLRAQHGRSEANALLYRYLKLKNSHWLWPREEEMVKENIICHLITEGRLSLTDIRNFGHHEIMCLLGNNSDYLAYGRYRDFRSRDNFDYSAISEAWKRYLINVKKFINWQEFRRKPPITQVLFPLVLEKIISEDQLQYITELRFKPYLQFMHTTPWESPRRAHAQFAKLQERMPFYVTIMRIVLDSIDNEIKRINRQTLFCIWHSFSNQNAKVRQLEESKLMIESLALIKLRHLNDEKIEDWSNNFHQFLAAEIKHLANDSKINGKRNRISYFLKKLAGIILAACGIGIPLAFTTYRDTFFKTKTAANLQQLARSIEVPEHKASSLKT